MKPSGRNITAVGTTSVMSRIVDQIFKQLRIDEEVVLSHGKLNALKDAVICAPEMMTKAFYNKNDSKSFCLIRNVGSQNEVVS